MNIIRFPPIHEITHYISLVKAGSQHFWIRIYWYLLVFIGIYWYLVLFHEYFIGIAFLFAILRLFPNTILLCFDPVVGPVFSVFIFFSTLFSAKNEGIGSILSILYFGLSMLT